MHPSLIFLPGALLSEPELSAARLDGLLFEIGDGYMLADAPEDEAARVAALGAVLAPGYAASGPTAAWLLGFGDHAPHRHHIQRVASRRVRIAPQRDVIVHEMRLAPTDVQQVASCLATTPQRTMSDLSLLAHHDPECAFWLGVLAGAKPELVRPVREEIASRPRMPGKKAAVARLDEFLSA